jgi:hypothetical protein
MTYGYAIVTDGEIDVRTVSPTKTSAMVNWLYLNGNSMPLDTWTDRRVESEFTGTPKRQTFLKRVKIEVEDE